MNCEEAKQACHRRPDDGKANEELERHLAHCDSCRRYVADMERLTAALAELRDETQRVRSTRGASAAPPRLSRDLLRVAAAFALAAGLFGAYWTWSSSSAPPAPNGGGRIVAAGDSNRVETTREGDAEAEFGITLRGESARSLLAVAVRTKDPAVQMYWLYPSLNDGAVHSP